MGLVRSESANDDQRFRYQALASPGSSIRLIEVDPEFSTNGTLPIRFLDSALSEEYTYLSYVRGQDNEEGGGPFPILVNGRTFHRRLNLKDFLHVARVKYPKCRFWIDVICINQANTPERNHQVQQMGEIYSGAREVIAWLGCEKLAAEYIPFLDDRARHEYKHLPADIGRNSSLIAQVLIWKYSFGMIGSTPPKRLLRRNAFYDAVRKYWQRAWVTQEIALAKHVCLLVHETEFDLTAVGLAKLREYRFTFPWQLLLMYTTSVGDYESRGHLLELLSRYQTKKRVVERDRIFSLLCVCIEGADLHVNYSLSDKKLLRNVLEPRVLLLVSVPQASHLEASMLRQFQKQSSQRRVFSPSQYRLQEFIRIRRH